MRIFGARAVLAAAVALSCSCIAYNEPCAGLVENPDDVVGYIEGQVFLDKNNARHANNSLARLAAEAFIDAHKDSSAPAQFGFMNGGAIRNEGGVEGADGQCVARNIFGQDKQVTPVTNGDVHAIMLFENQVYAIDLTEGELFSVMEHSVSALTAQVDGNPDTPIISPSGRFLNVAGGEVRVDCSLKPGERVTQIKVGNRTLTRGGVGLVRVAMPEFLLRGGDGYSMIAAVADDASRNPVQAQKAGGIDNDITAAYMKEKYGDESTPFVAHDATDRVNCVTGEGTVPACIDPPPEQGQPPRVVCCKAPVKLVNCAAPTAPEG